MGRFLTQEDKQEELLQWQRLQSSCGPDHRSCGGRGDPDPEMFIWCDRLNEIPGLCTLQSCAGHGSAKNGAVASPGHLWIWLDPAMSAAFDREAFQLAVDTRHIERVTREYAAWGQEIASITFAGNERDLLSNSMRVILAFFQKLRERRP